MPVSLEPGSSNGGGTPANSNGGGQDNSGNNGGAANQHGNGSPGGQQTQTNTGDWLAGLSPENKTMVEQKGWKTADDVLKSYSEIQKAFSGRDPKASTYKLSDYSFTAPTDEAAKKQYSPERAEALKQFAQKTGISPDHAAALHDFYISNSMDEGKKSAAKYTADINAKFEAASQSLEKSWGVPDSPGFKRNAEMAFRTIRELGIGDTLAEAGLLVKTPEGKMNVANAKIVEALAKVGASMYAEDSMYGNTAATANPFAVGTATENATKAGEIMRNDPDKAEALIRAAGPTATSMYSFWLSSRKK